MMEIKFWQNIALQKQGINGSPLFREGTVGAETAIKTLGYIQIDTLNIIERAHHHTLWNRVTNYRPDDLNILMAQRKIFEHWHHALSYLPIDDYRFAIPFMQRIKSRDTPYYKKHDLTLMRSIIERIKSDGPLKLRDLKENKVHITKKGAWNSRPAKRALQVLFLQGDLMVSGREKMERVYDLTENILPSHISTTPPTPIEYATYLIETTLRANGFATLNYILHGKSTAALKQQVQDILDQKMKAGEIACHKTDFMPPVYASKNLTKDNSSSPQGHVKILSPFDNMLINRDRAEQLFEFSYRLECYTPVAKRQYGYFCLPILYGTELVGRIDCKAHRKEGILEILHFHIEKHLENRDTFFTLFVEELYRFAHFNQCENIEIVKSSTHKAELADYL